MGLFDEYFGGAQQGGGMPPGGILQLLDLLKTGGMGAQPAGFPAQGNGGAMMPVPQSPQTFSQGGGPIMPAMAPGRDFSGGFAPPMPPPIDVASAPGQLPATSSPTSMMPPQQAPYFPQQAPPNPQGASPGGMQGSPGEMQGGMTGIGDVLGGIGKHLGAGLQGFVNSNGLLPGVANLVSGLATGQRSDPVGIYEQRQNAFYHELMKSGVPKEQAFVIAQSPKAQELWIAQQIAPKFEKAEATSALGEKFPLAFDPSKGTYKDAAGKPYGAPGGQTTGLGDSSLVGEAYLKQFPPEIQASVKNYINANTTPTGNPRQGFTQAVKEIAAKYGADIGHNVDETTFPQRRTMMVDLAKSTPGSAGGQITFGRTAINHLANTAESAAALDNSNGLGFAPLASAINSVRGLTTEQAAKIGALNTNSQKYGQEITKFYAGSGGGEAERMGFLKSLAGAKSSEELASVLEAEKNLIPGRLHELRNKIESTLGPAGAAKYEVMSTESENSIKRIDAAIAKLRGQAPAAETSVAPAVADGATATNPKTGQQLVLRGGKWVPAQ